MAAALVGRHLGTKPLWLDEAVSVSVARRSFWGVLSVLPHHDANAGVYYVILHWVLLLGHTAAWARSLSAVCFALTAGLASWVGTRWRGAWFGLACGLLVATNPFLLFYGQEARPYALAVLLAVASTAALFSPSRRWYVAATIALLYVDLFALLFVVAVGWRRGRDLWSRIGLAVAPLAVLVVSQRGQISWLPRPSLAVLFGTFRGMAGSGPALVVVVVLVVLAGRESPPLVAAFVGPPVALWIVGQFVPAYTARYVICSTIAMIGLVALRARWPVLVLLGALGLSSVVRLEARPLKYENTPALVAFVASRTQSGDAVGYSGGGLRTLIDTYRGTVFPVDVALAGSQHDIYARQVAPPVLASRLAAVSRIWLITDPTDHGYPTYGPFQPLHASFLQAFRASASSSFPGIDVTLYVRVRSPTP